MDASTRPPVAVIVPLAGSHATAAATLVALSATERREGDELMIVYTSGSAQALRAAPDVRFIPAHGDRQTAANLGVDSCEQPWVLLLDQRARPRPDLLDRFFDPVPAARCGAIIGAGSSLLEANLLVRREAWRDVGGLHHGLRAGSEVDLCRRLARAGWEIERRPDADAGLPRRRAPVRAAAARAWLARRHPDGAPAAAPGLPALGGLLGNASAAAPARPVAAAAALPRIGVLVDVVPELSETFVVAELRALTASGHAVHVAAHHRARRAVPGAVDGLDVRWMEDDGLADQLLALARLAASHPWACLTDRIERRRWGREEPVVPLRVLAPAIARLHAAGVQHLHAHFAAGAALDALRIGRIAGLPYSVTAHAYDIYQQPRNLAEKLDKAAFVTSGCDYTVNDLRALVDPGRRESVHRIVMGVDADRFTRTRAPRGGRELLAVGRLVDKKGFADLLDAVALLEHEHEPLERVRIVGEGPLRADLEAQLAALGLGHRVQLLGARSPAEVRDLLDEVDLLVMPCVVAADGDRDSMPVVVKEALAMQVPVVATREVGLPELVSEAWGRLVAPRDPPALAAGIAEVLALDLKQRIAMGAAGREHVREHCDVTRETARLAALIADTVRTSHL